MASSPVIAIGFALGLVLASEARIHRQREVPETAKVGDGTDATEHCKKLCAADKGTDADPEYCENECAVYTDVNEFDHDGPTVKGLHDFVEDESFNEENEDGGEAMEKVYEEDFPMPVADCHPEREAAPSFEDMDINGDGKVSEEEAKFRGQELCVPNEKTEQIFSHADANQDKAIDKGEFEDGGEDTKVEEAIDEALAPQWKGDDEYNEVQSPTDEDGVKVMSNFDKNKDGTLDESEFDDAVEFENERRGTEDDELKTHTMVKAAKPDVHKGFDKVDANDDNVITPDEYAAKSEDTTMGTEMAEETESDQKAEDPDNSNRVKAPAPAAASMMAVTRRFSKAQRAQGDLNRRFSNAQREEAEFLNRFKGKSSKPKPKVSLARVESSYRVKAQEPAAASMMSLTKRFSKAQQAEAEFLNRFKDKSSMTKVSFAQRLWKAAQEHRQHGRKQHRVLHRRFRH